MLNAENWKIIFADGFKHKSLKEPRQFQALSNRSWILMDDSGMLRNSFGSHLTRLRTVGQVGDNTDDAARRWRLAGIRHDQHLHDVVISVPVKEFPFIFRPLSELLQPICFGMFVLLTLTVLDKFKSHLEKCWLKSKFENFSNLLLDVTLFNFFSAGIYFLFQLA